MADALSGADGSTDSKATGKCARLLGGNIHVNL